MHLYMFRKETYQQAFALMGTYWIHFEYVLKTSLAIFCFSRRLEDFLEDGKLLRFIKIKTENSFVISLDFGYVPHHCDTIGSSYICMMLLTVCAYVEITFSKSALIGLSIEL